MALNHPHTFRRLSLVPILGLPLLLACGSESLKPKAPVDPVELYWELDLNHHAVTMSTTPPYDTLTLVATPRNYLGEALPETVTPQYVSRDLNRVVVLPNGLVRVTAVTGTPTWVIATATIDNVKHVDSVQVRVVNATTPPVLASFSVHPVPPDSAKSPANSSEFILPDTLPVRALDAGGVAITGLPVYFRSSDPTMATIGRTSGAVTGIRPGTVTLYASTTAFGVTKADTLSYRVGGQMAPTVRISKKNAPDGSTIYVSQPFEVRLATGGIVLWDAINVSNLVSPLEPLGLPIDIDVLFNDDDLPNVAPANTALFFPAFWCPRIEFFGIVFGYGTDCSIGGNAFLTVDRSLPLVQQTDGFFRAFPTPGTYEYHSTLQPGVRGRIVVVADD